MGGKAARALGFGNHLFYGIIILSDTPGRFADTAGFRGAKKMVVDSFDLHGRVGCVRHTGMGNRPFGLERIAGFLL